jgi:hypothetical protein
VPFVSKCIGVSLAKVAARCMAGQTLAEQGFTREIIPTHYDVKENSKYNGPFPRSYLVGVPMVPPLSLCSLLAANATLALNSAEYCFLFAMPTGTYASRLHLTAWSDYGMVRLLGITSVLLRR